MMGKSFYDIWVEDAKNDGIEKIVAGAVIKNSEGKILLLTRRADDFMPDIDELPSGNLENGENILDGLAREITEETGMGIAEICGFINSFDYLSGSGKRARQYNFSIIPDREEVTLTEHDKYKWQTLDEARANPNVTAEVKKSLDIYAHHY